MLLPQGPDLGAALLALHQLLAGEPHPDAQTAGTLRVIAKRFIGALCRAVPVRGRASWLPFPLFGCAAFYIGGMHCTHGCAAFYIGGMHCTIMPATDFALLQEDALLPHLAALPDNSPVRAAITECIQSLGEPAVLGGWVGGWVAGWLGGGAQKRKGSAGLAVPVNAC